MPAPINIRIKADKLGLEISHFKNEAEDYYSFEYRGEPITKRDVAGLEATLDDLLAERAAFEEFADMAFEDQRAEAFLEMADQTAP